MGQPLTGLLCTRYARDMAIWPCSFMTDDRQGGRHVERSLSEIARLVQKSERTIRRWIANGTIAVAIRDNGTYEISEEEILKHRPADEYTAMLSHMRRIENLQGAILERIQV